MAKINITGMDAESLLELRDRIDQRLGEHRRSLEKQLNRLGIGEGSSRGKASLKGRKVAPKFRSKKDPKLTWAGRGAMPLWMREEMKAGKLKKDAFLIK